MKQNMGNADRLIRLIVAAFIGILYYTEIIGDTLGMILLALAGIFVLTSFIRVCPLYLPFGVNTCKKD